MSDQPSPESQNGISKTEFDVKYASVQDRLSSIDKRLDDVKWYVGGVTALFGIVFAVIGIIYSNNFTSERSGLIDFKNDVRADLQISVKPPHIEVLGPKRIPIENAEVFGTINKYRGGTYLNFHYALFNSGGSNTGKIEFKFYSKKPLVLVDENSNNGPQISTDKDDFDYENLQTDIPGNELPAQMSVEYFFGVPVAADFHPPKGTVYSMAGKLFYGTNNVTDYNFKVTMAN